MGVIEQVEALEGWDLVWEEPDPGYVLGETDAGECVLVQITPYCDHEPCYETHTIQIIVRVGDDHFCRHAEYSSSEGFILTRGMWPVVSREKVVKTWMI